MKNDPRVIAAYLGVDDEEVGDVLTEVGDDQVLQQLEGGPDMLHGPHSSSSMMAGSVMDTIDHSDPAGERVTHRAERIAGQDHGCDATAARLRSASNGRGCGRRGRRRGKPSAEPRRRQGRPTASCATGRACRRRAAARPTG